MTSYFDTAHEEVRLGRTRPDYGVMISRFEEVESRVVFDCTVAAMMPGFPADLREAIHRTVLEHGICTLPVNAPPADFETEDDYKRRLDALLWDLHTIFHEVAHRGLDGFTDQPPTPMRRLYALGEEEREKLVAGEALPERTDPLTAALAEVSAMRTSVAVAESRVKRAFAAGARWREDRPEVLGEFEAIDAAEDLYPYGLDT